MSAGALEVLEANQASISVRRVGSDQRWTFYIVERNDRREMSTTFNASESAGDLPDAEEAVQPFRFAAEVAKERGFID